MGINSLASELQEGSGCQGLGIGGSRGLHAGPAAGLPTRMRRLGGASTKLRSLRLGGVSLRIIQILSHALQKIAQQFFFFAAEAVKKATIHKLRLGPKMAANPASCVGQSHEYLTSIRRRELPLQKSKLFKLSHRFRCRRPSHRDFIGKLALRKAIVPFQHAQEWDETRGHAVERGARGKFARDTPLRIPHHETDLLVEDIVSIGQSRLCTR